MSGGGRGNGELYICLILFPVLNCFAWGRGWGDIVPQSTRYVRPWFIMTKLILSNVQLCWSYSLTFQDGGTCLTRLRFQRNLLQWYKDILILLTFFNTFNILTPKFCIQRITKTENVKKLPKLQFYKLRRIFGIVYGANQFASVIKYLDT